MSRRRGRGEGDGIGHLYPTARARDAADLAIDKLSPNEPMRVFIAEWERIYFEAGGLIGKGAVT